MGGRNIPRNASLVLSAIAAAALAQTPAPPTAQTPAPPPAFEVASIRPAPPLNPADIVQGKVHIGTRIDAGRVDIGALSMAELIRMAWEVKPYQISGPDWISTERFNILAKMPDGATKEQVPAMLKALLQERFKLATHKENREHPVYALIVRKNGAKLEEAPAASESQAPSDDSPSPKKGMSIDTPDGTVRINRAPDGKGVEMTNPKTGPSKMTMGPDGLLHMDMSRVTMANFADMLSRYVDRPVLDETGLKGEYHVALDLSMQDMMRLAKSAGVAVPGMGPMAPAPGGSGSASPADAASDPGGGGSVFNAVERLGLKLDPKKEPVETIVVDHIEKTPTEN